MTRHGGRLVRVRFKTREKNVGAAYAIAHALHVLDEPTRLPDGRLRPMTRLHGRPLKRRLSIDEAAARKKSAARARRMKQKEAL